MPTKRRENNNEYKIKSTYAVTKTQEISVDWNVYNFLVIYGKHINGWFISIPNWRVCTEAGHPTDVFYNTKMLESVVRGDVSSVIAQAIREHWESNHADL